MQNREQSVLRLLLCDPRPILAKQQQQQQDQEQGEGKGGEAMEVEEGGSGGVVRSEVLVEERSAYWVNLHELFRPLQGVYLPRELQQQQQ